MSASPGCAAEPFRYDAPDIEQAATELMSAEQESGPAFPSSDLPVADGDETITDLIDRMDREAFRRVLEQREPRPLEQPPRR